MKPGLGVLFATAGLAVAGRAAAPGLEPVAKVQAQIRANFFVADPWPALAPAVHRRFTPAPGVAAEAVTYATQFGTRVPAILYRPEASPGTARRPAFIVVNGHGGDKYAWYSYYTGVTFARAGRWCSPTIRPAKASGALRGSRVRASTIGCRAMRSWLAGWRA